MACWSASTTRAGTGVHRFGMPRRELNLHQLGKKGYNYGISMIIYVYIYISYLCIYIYIYIHHTYVFIYIYISTFDDALCPLSFWNCISRKGIPENDVFRCGFPILQSCQYQMLLIFPQLFRSPTGCLRMIDCCI